MFSFNFNPHPIIETPRFILRGMIKEDDQQIFRLRSLPEKNKYIDRPLHKSIEETRAFIKMIQEGIQDNKWTFWAITHRGQNELLGTVCFWNLDAEKGIGEIGYELDPLFQKQGIMAEIIPFVLDFGFTQMRLKRIDAFTHFENQASKRLLERCNFKLDTNRVDEENANNLVYSLFRASN